MDAAAIPAKRYWSVIVAGGARHRKTHTVPAPWCTSFRGYRRVQFLTIGELLEGKQVHMPPTAQTFKQAPKAEKGKEGQRGIDF